MRAVAYARYSSDLQSDASVDDQFRECRQFATRQGMTLIEEFSDRAISGALFEQRPGIQAVLSRVRKGDIEAVVSESIDRISRDQEHQARIFKQLTFWGCKIVTISEGEVDELRIGFSGTMAALYLKNLGQKTRRGMRGKAEKGFIGGGKCYGYDIVKTDAGSEYRINKAQARTVIRIFEWFADGRSPKWIAHELNRLGVPSPRGGHWSPSCIYGDPSRHTGMLANEIFIGRLVWGRRKWRKNPMTEKRVYALADPGDLVEVEKPELRIIDRQLWDRVHDRQREQAKASTAIRKALHEKARTGAGPKFLLSSLLKCGHCGANFTMANTEHYACATHVNRGPSACPNKLRVKREVAEKLILEAVKRDLLTPEFLDAFKAEVRRLLRERRSHAAKDEGDAKRELARIDRELANLVNAIKQGIVTVTTRRELEKLEAERATLERRLKVGTEPLDNIEHMLPRVIDRYAELVTDLEKSVSRQMSRARNTLKELLGDIRLVPKDGHLDAHLQANYPGVIALMNEQKSPGIRAGAGLGKSGCGGRI